MQKAQALACLRCSLREAAEDRDAASDDLLRSFHQGRVKAFQETLLLLSSVDAVDAVDWSPDPPRTYAPKKSVTSVQPSSGEPADEQDEPLTFLVGDRLLRKLTPQEAHATGEQWLTCAASDRLLLAAPGSTRCLVQRGEFEAFDIGIPRIAYVRRADVESWAEANNRKLASE